MFAFLIPAFGLPGGSEWLIILLIALLIFGSRLPSVMRSLGRSVIEFKKGMHDVTEEVEGVEKELKTTSEMAKPEEKKV